jgi:hypothetical protein
MRNSVFAFFALFALKKKELGEFMFRSFVVFVFISIPAFAQLPNQQGQIWREYDLRPVTMPPVHVAVNPHDAPLPMQAPSIIDIVKRETGEAAWSAPGFGIVHTEGHRLFVYNTPAVQQKVAETIGRFQRPETKNIRFVMETNYLTLTDNFFERMGVGFDMVFRNGDSVQLPLTENAVVISDLDVYRSDEKGRVKRVTGAEKAELLERWEKMGFFPFSVIDPFKYLRPILGRDGKPICKEPGVDAFWVAKEDMPKMREALQYYFKATEGDQRNSRMEIAPIVTFNGQLGAVLDTKPFQLTTKAYRDPQTKEMRPITTTFNVGHSHAACSLLSWDGRTVSSDVHFEAFAITQVREEAVEEIHIHSPKTESLTVSEKGMVWPADGMLVIIHKVNRLSESRIEAGTPILNKIPYIKRFFPNVVIGRETQTAMGIITVRMLAPNEEAHTATVPRVTKR